MNDRVYDVIYDYYGDDDAQIALVLSVFSLVMASLAWLRKVKSSLYIKYKLL